MSGCVANDEVSCVEHIEYLHVATGYLMVDKVLIASELGGMVATHSLVEIAWHSLHEVLLVIDAIVHGGVAQNLVIDGTSGERWVVDGHIGHE